MGGCFHRLNTDKEITELATYRPLPHSGFDLLRGL